MGIGYAVHYVLDTIRNLQAQLVEKQSQLRGVDSFLNLFTRSLATVEEVDHTMQLVAQYVARILKAKSLAVFTVAEDPVDSQKKLLGCAVSGSFPPFHMAPDAVKWKARYLLEHMQHDYIAFSEGVLGQVARKQEGMLLEKVDERERRLWRLPEEVRTLIAVPMSENGQLIGVVCAVNCRNDERFFTKQDLHMLEHLSSQVAVSLDLISIYSRRSEQQRIVQELEFGRDIQQSLLPARLPEWGDYSFAAFSNPALEVAGDFYDFVEIDQDRLMVVVADATGKGVPACLLMAMCRSFVRSLVENYVGLGEFLQDLNRCLFRDTDKAHFVTMAVVVINRKTHVCECGSAGHTPLFLSMGDGTSRQVNPQGPAIGLLPNELDLQFDTLSFCFSPGSRLMLYTDGLNEALNDEDEEFGLVRLEKLWCEKKADPPQMANLILKEVRNFAGGRAQTDDQTLAIISRANTETVPSSDDAANAPLPAEQG
jgi:sigma-B regulation protein RsbU (phosphoserine phosphatase)